MSSKVTNVEKTKEDIRALSSFVDSTFTRESYVHEKCVSLIASLTKEVLQQEQLNLTRDKLTLKVQVNFGNAMSTRSVIVDRSATLADLKALIETQFGNDGILERIKVRKSGRALGQFDSRTLLSCDIGDGEELAADCRSAMQSTPNYDKSLKGLSRVGTSSVHPTTAFESLVVAMHCFMLDLDFVCVLEQANATPGFAPSLRGEVQTKILECI